MVLLLTFVVLVLIFYFLCASWNDVVQQISPVSEARGAKLKKSFEIKEKLTVVLVIIMGG